jgi:peptide-methionine (S)-S-oxide reductase
MTNKFKIISLLSLTFLLSNSFLGCGQKESTKTKKQVSSKSNPAIDMNKLEIATFGNGCFWCTEAIFQNIEGVEKVESGYTGGNVLNPTYKQVCTGETGHAEVLQIYFDPAKVSFDLLLEVFWQTHDPTTLNRQGNDSGTQYRSAIFYHSEKQKELATKYKAELQNSGAFSRPIVTEIVPSAVFYKAEDYHQNYFNENGSQPYCTFVIKPKVDKFEKIFKDKLKKN